MKTTGRNSNFEFLRIIAMIMIVFFHYHGHGQIQVNNGTFLNSALCVFFCSYGKLGVVIFVMLTGYFSCTSRFNAKRLILLFFEVVFYSVVWYIVACLIGEDIFEITRLVESFSVLFFSKYWFFTCYIALSLISPLLNIVIRNVSRKQHFIVCIVGGFIYSFVASVSNYLYYSDLIYFLYLYIVAAYIRLYDGTRSIKFDIVGVIVAFILAWVIHIFNYYVPTESGMHSFLFQQFILQSTTNLFIGIFLINICKKIKPRSSKFVNYVAASVFGVYLIHDSPYRQFIWVKLFKNATYYQQGFFVFGLHMFLTVITVYVCATIIDILRRELLEKYFSKLYDICCVKIKNSKFASYIRKRLDKLDG